MALPPKQLALHLENLELIRKLGLVRMLTRMLALLLSLMLQPDQQTLGQRVEVHQLGKQALELTLPSLLMCLDLNLREMDLEMK